MPLFDRDRYQRLPLDVSGGGVGGSGARRPSSSCTTATIVLFVGLCLVGAWMMASTSSVPISVSPENKSEAKEEDRSVDLINSVNGAGVGGGDTPQTTEDVVDAGKNDDGPGGTPETSTDDAGDTDKKDDGGGATQTTDAAAAGSDVSQSSVAETVDAAANSTIGGEGKLASDTVARGEAPSNNQTFSDENGTTEGGELVNPEDPDKKAENSASEATTGVQPDKSTEQNTDEAPRDAKGTGDQVDTDSEKASPDGDNTETGDQVDTDSEKASPDGDTTENGDQVDEISEKASPDGDTTETGNQVDKNSEKASPDGDTTATGAQVDKISEKASPDGDTTETGDQVDKISEKASPDGDTTETGGQDEKNAEAAPTSETKKTGGQVTKITVDKDAEETPAYAKDAGDDGTAKNQTAFDDQNGNLDGDQNGEKARATDDDDTAGAGGASKNQTLGVGDQNDVLRNQTFAAVHGTINGTLSQEAETVGTDSSAIAEDEPVISEPETVELLPSGQAELLNETAAASAQSGTFPTQATESSEEKKARASREKKKNNKNKNNGAGGETSPRVWKLCNVTAGADYIPCLDNEAAIRGLKSTKHYEHRERHCPSAPPECLVPLPEGYRRPIPWPHSRDKIWYHNVPHTKLASYKGNQNWVKVSGEHLVFPGGGTQFTNGASHYIDVIQEALPEVAWGRRSRVVLDVGCGVASFGGYLFDRDALTMSFAPKDEHEAQVQFALERGIPAISAVMGTRRLPFPSGAFDLVHCARCRVPWHIEGGKLLLELNRLLRPGGLFVWSATPVYRKNPEDVGIWQAMAALTKSMCWEMVKRTSDTVDQTAMVIFKKPSSNDCYDKRQQPEPPLCDDSDDPNAAWNVTLQSCMHRVPTDPAARGSRWPGQWPERLTATPYWLGDGQVGAYGKPAPDDFAADSEHWRRAVNNSYLAGMGIDWSDVRNVMDMRAVYGGFAAALRDMKVWVMNVVTVDSPDTLPIIYERGLFGMYHDWCESFSTYPRTYDLVHADHLFSKIKDRCKLLPVITEVDRILRPEGKLIVRDDRFTVEEVEKVARSLHWEVAMDVSKETERLLCFKKTMWRPTEVEALS